ncbi:MAG: zinc-binding dehydrogenase [Candidatus Bathyarchaeia archaeon]
MSKPGSIGIREFPVPDIEPRAALVRMVMSGICGTDKHTFEGMTHHAGFQVSFPIIPGHENLSIIEKLGRKDDGWYDGNGKPLKEGDRVAPVPDVPCGECYICRNFYGWSWCERICAYGGQLSCKDPPHLLGGWAEDMYILPKTILFKVPDDMPDKIAVLTEPMSVAYSSLARAMTPYWLVKEGGGPGDSVVIQGSGPIGLVHATMAKMAGAGRVIVIGDPNERLDVSRQVGADDTISIEKYPTPEERVEEVLALTDGRGAELVIECVGSPGAFKEGLDMVSLGGTYLEVGNYVDAGTVSINPHNILSKCIRIIGVNGNPYQAFGRVLKLMELNWKRFNLDKLVTHSYKIDEAESALAMTQSLKGLKVIITPS